MNLLAQKAVLFGIVTFISVWSAISASDDGANDTDLIHRDNSLLSRNQISEISTNDRILTGLRTYLMGIRNFAEAIGKFVPSDEFMKSENNKISSKYNTLFSSVRMISQAVQYVVSFLEDLLNNDKDNGEFKKISDSFKLPPILPKFRSAFSTIRSIAGQILNTYNYYFPEISYTRCVGNFVRREYPAVLSEINFDNTYRLLNAAYLYAINYIRDLIAENKSIVGTKVAEMGYSDLNDYQNNYQGQQLPQNDYNHNYQELQQSQQELYSLYNPNLALPIVNNGLEARTSRLVGDSDEAVLYVGPRQLDDVSIQDNPQYSSVFDFDDIVKERLGIKAQESSMGQLNEEGESFGKCTQLYAVEVLWRSVEGFLSSER